MTNGAVSEVTSSLAPFGDDVFNGAVSKMGSTMQPARGRRMYEGKQNLIKPTVCYITDMYVSDGQQH